MSLYKELAKEYGLEEALIKAVSDVESGGSAYWSDGSIKFLQEPHLLWRLLVKKGISPNTLIKNNPSLSQVLYQKWGEKPYPKGVIERKKLLDLATTIDKELAYQSASWGAYQILGTHAKSLGFTDSLAFVEYLKESEDNNLRAFMNFIKVNKLIVYLKHKDFTEFARRYNGPSFAKNKYDEKLKAAYEKYSK